MNTEARMIPVLFTHRRRFRTRPAYQNDYGQSLRLEGFPGLPSSFEMHYANPGSDAAITQIGLDGIVPVPDSLLAQDATISAWLYLHETGYDGETRFEIEIPVRPRPAAPTEDPDPERENVITQAILAMNETIVRTLEYFLKAEGHAQGTQDGTPVESGSPYFCANAKFWAEAAEQAAANAGYMFFWIDDETGDLMLFRTDAVDADFSLDAAGDLILTTT